MSDLPEGVDKLTVLSHVTSVQILAQLINATAQYMSEPEGSGGEEVAEEILGGLIGSVVDMHPDVVGNVMLAALSLIVEVIEPEPVQAWFDHQKEKIEGALGE